MIVGDLEYWLVWILNGKKRDWFCKWSGFLMGSEIWKPNYLKSGQMATISSKTIWDPDKNVWLLNDLFLQHWTTLFHGNHFCQFIQLLHCTNVCLWRYARTLFRRAIYWWRYETHYAHNIHRPILGVYLDKLAQVQVVINCQYSVAQMCTREDTHNCYLDAPSIDDVLRQNTLIILHDLI